jgi:hypothetical protein
MGFLPKYTIAMAIGTFLQFCVISISLQSFITVRISHMKQQLGCSTYCVVLCCLILITNFVILVIYFRDKGFLLF